MIQWASLPRLDESAQHTKRSLGRLWDLGGRVLARGGLGLQDKGSGHIVFQSRTRGGVGVLSGDCSDPPVANEARASVTMEGRQAAGIHARREGSAGNDTEKTFGARTGVASPWNLQRKNYCRSKSGREGEHSRPPPPRIVNKNTCGEGKGARSNNVEGSTVENEPFCHPGFPVPVLRHRGCLLLNPPDKYTHTCTRLCINRVLESVLHVAFSH